MRRWLVLLLVVLLPLRAVAGDAMAFGMASEATTVSSAGMSPECPMHLAAAAADPADGDDAPASTGSTDCGSCALCFPVSQPTPIVAVGVERPSDAPRAVADDRFASALALGLLRPPEP